MSLNPRRCHFPHKPNTDPLLLRLYAAEETTIETCLVQIGFNSGVVIGTPVLGEIPIRPCEKFVEAFQGCADRRETRGRILRTGRHSEMNISVNLTISLSVVGKSISISKVRNVTLIKTYSISISLAYPSQIPFTRFMLYCATGP